MSTANADLALFAHLKQEPNAAEIRQAHRFADRARALRMLDDAKNEKDPVRRRAIEDEGIALWCDL